MRQHKTVARPPIGRSLDSERQGLWACYYVKPDALDELSAWLR